MNRGLRASHRVADSFVDWKPPRGMEPFGGSQWWSLTHDCLTSVMEQIESVRIRRFFRYTDSPDELLFQSIIMNSRFAERVRAYDLHREWQLARSATDLPEEAFNFRYIDWSPDRFEPGEDGTAPRGPTTLLDRDFESIAASTAILARKFHPTRSAPVLDRIDQELLSEN